MVNVACSLLLQLVDDHMHIYFSQHVYHIWSGALYPWIDVSRFLSNEELPSSSFIHLTSPSRHLYLSLWTPTLHHRHQILPSSSPQEVKIPRLFFAVCIAHLFHITCSLPIREIDIRYFKLSIAHMRASRRENRTYFPTTFNFHNYMYWQVENRHYGKEIPRLYVPFLKPSHWQKKFLINLTVITLYN